MKPLIKICGITNMEDALSVSRLDVWALGFIFADSERRVTPRKAKGIVDILPPYITRVGVFVNESAENIEKTVSSCGLDMVQLHGDESPGLCNDIMRFTRVIKAFRVKDEESLKDMRAYNIDLCLLDAYADRAYGGTGKTFCWDLAIKAKAYCKNIILSGGLNPDNILEAIERVEPYGLDISSGVEASPGKKDAALVEKLVYRVKNYRGN